MARLVNISLVSLLEDCCPSTEGNMQRKRLTPQDLPAGVTADAIPLPGGGRTYRFTHNRLGLLGILIISGAGPTHTQVSCESAPGADPDSAEWGERYDLFRQVATLCLNALAFGDSKVALPSLEEARLQGRLYQRFLHCQHSLDMLALAKQLSWPEYEQLLAAIQMVLITASPTDGTRIEQRRGELQRYWADLQEG
jgi:hypothetical protein